MMPRFFFNVHDGTELADLEGAELQDFAAARVEAVRVAGSLIAEMGERFWSLESDWSLEVTDESGAMLFVLTFSARRALL